jgi:dTDP-4-dehydrorhamnose reductase
VRILLFGKTGQVGHELQRSLSKLGDLVVCSRQSEKKAELDSQTLSADFTNLEALAQTVRSVSPDVIVNAAAYTAVDDAETNQERCRMINALAPQVLGQEAKKLNAWLVHYSTDYIFDGTSDEAMRESERPNPLNVYGQTKLEGEQLIQSSGCKHLIFRTSWVHSARGSNFPKTILRLAKERDQISVVADQVGAPTRADLIAEVTAHAIALAYEHPELGGVYNLAATGETSWHQYATFVIDHAHRAGKNLKLLPSQVRPIVSSEFPKPAARPKNSRLDTSKLRTTFKLDLPDWQSGVTKTLSEILQEEL